MGGVTKALLEVGGRPIIERVVMTLGKVFQEVIVITNTHDQFDFLGLPMFEDLIPGHGSLGGLYTGLTVCSGAHGFLVACDMPFLNARVIEHLAALADDHDVVIPRVTGLLEPLHAIYSRHCVPHIRDLMDRGDLKIINLFSSVDVLEVSESELAVLDPTLRFIMNVNTPGELAAARALADQEELF